MQVTATHITNIPWYERIGRSCITTSSRFCEHKQWKKEKPKTQTLNLQTLIIGIEFEPFATFKDVSNQITMFPVVKWLQLCIAKFYMR